MSHWGQRKLPINTQILWFILHLPTSSSFLTQFLYSSSFSLSCLLAPPPPPPPPPPTSACTPLPPPATVLGYWDVFVYSTTPPCMPPQYFGCFSPLSPPLPRFLLQLHRSQCFSLPSCRQQSISSLCWGLLLEREAVLQVNCAFVSIRLPQLNDLTP